MLMKELEGTGNRVRSIIYSRLFGASWDVIDYDNYYKKPHRTVKQQYDNFTLRELLDALNIQQPEDIKRFRGCGDGCVAELKKLLEETKIDD